MSAVVICSRPECQTSAGCVCNQNRTAGWPPPMGCICPPTSEQTCRNPLCPRRNPFEGSVMKGLAG